MDVLSIARDLRYSLRRLRSRPIYALITVLTLAIGVGGTAAIYSIMQGILLKPLPFSAQSEIAVFWNQFDWSEREFLSFRPEWPGFRSVAAYRNQDVALERRDAPVKLVHGISASAELFQVLGTSPQLGRAFQPGDDALGAGPVLVLSHSLWRELGGDRNIIGKPVRLDGAERTVVGVMPPGFWFPDPSIQVWLPEPLDPENRSGNYALVGRMNPGQTVATMATPLDQITRLLGERFEYSEQWDKTRNAQLTPVTEFLVGALRPGLVATLIAMGLILLIGCANVAALMLGQLESRSSELTVQVALGADRGRLAQQLVVEAGAIGFLAGIVGTGIAIAVFHLLVRTLPLSVWGESLSFNWILLASAMAIALLSSVLLSLVPAIALTRRNLRSGLSSMRSSGIGGGGTRLEGGIVVVEVALAVLMAAGAALLIRSVNNLYQIDPGLDPANTAVVDVILPQAATQPERSNLVRSLLTQLSTLPGVGTVAAAQRLPLRGGGDNWGLEVVGHPDQPDGTTSFRIVSHQYFETMGIVVVNGRGFLATDRAETEPVVVINQSMARKYFGAEDPLGRTLNTGLGRPERIVGVVADAAEGNLTDEPAPARYMLYDQIPYTPQQQSFVLRMRGSTAVDILGVARSTAEGVSPGLAIQQTTTMDQVFSQAVGPARQIMLLLTVLTGIALFLGAIGVYGVIAHFVQRRKKDWGIRITLGLTPGRVMAQVVRQGGLLITIGVGIGIVASLGTTRLLGSFLHGVGSADPIALLTASAVLFLVGGVAALIPAYRASRVNLASVLRDQ
jgi:putative ABC transport system permease protein